MTIWDLDLHHARDRIRPGSVVVDLGASWGEFAGPAQDAGATVLAVEPLPENAERLRAMGLDVLEAALGPSNGECELIVPEEPERRTGAHIEPDLPGTTRMVSLYTLIETVGPIDVLKCDIEGGEYEAFLATDLATLGQIRFMAIEFHVWTVGDQPRIPGVGHRPGSPMTYMPADLWRHLLATHTLELEGNFEAGGTIFATRRSEP